MQTTSKPSLDRARVVLVVVACVIGLLVGWASVLHTRGSTPPKIEEIRAFVSMLASLDATLAGFLSAAAALLYAVANTRLSAALRKSGHHRRIVIDLIVGMAMFIVGMLFASFAAFPAADLQQSTVVMLLAFSCGSSAAAVFMLIPIGQAFWLLLTKIDTVEDSATPSYDGAPLKL